MSLLMEALRKAEEAKRNIQNQTVDPGGEENHPEQPTPAAVVAAPVNDGFTLEEMEPAVAADYIVDNFLLGDNERDKGPSSTSESPVLSTGKPGRASVEELLNYLETTPELEETPPVPRKVPPVVKFSPAVQQRAAGAVFAAKQRPAQAHATRNMLLVLLALVIPIVGGVLWYLDYTSTPSFTVDPALLTIDVASRSLSDEQIIDQPTTLPSAQSSGAVTALSEQPQFGAADTGTMTAPVPQTEPPANQIQPDEDFADTGPLPVLTSAGPAPNATATPETSISAPAAAATANTLAASNPVPVLQVSRSKRASNNNQQLSDAYASLQAGDNAVAVNLYETVLEQFPNNRDALLGTAAIAVREGDVSRAREFYSRLMRLNPKDPLARTGLLQTVQDIDPLQHEQELQRLLQQFPDVAPLSFALGNVYASQQRWKEAQSAYFDAFLFARQSTESAINPDYAYNLAISLEQLNQPKAALDYYLQARTLARAVTPGFDRQALSSRITFLEQNRP